MTAINTHLSVITLNINGLNTPIKRHRKVEWVKKQNQSFCCFQETHFIFNDRSFLRMKGLEKYSKKMTRKQAGITIVMSEQTDFKQNLIR